MAGWYRAGVRLLVLGGTRFVGRAIVEDALARGWQVTAFHRGQSGAELFAHQPHFRRVTGDRRTDLSRLDGEWDAVVDCVGYFPADTQRSAEFLRDRVGHYVFISTISVYAAAETHDENSPVLPMPEQASQTEITADNYGPLKVECEQSIDAEFPGLVTHIRAGLQIGPHDPTGRFSDWVRRIGTRNEVAVPADADMPWQVIDAADTAQFTLRTVEDRRPGVFNVAGPPILMRDALNLIRETVRPSAQFAEFTEADLTALGIEPWREIALWLPADRRDGLPFHVSTARAQSAGLTCRPMEETIRAIYDQLPDTGEATYPPGLAPDREEALLARLEPS